MSGMTTSVETVTAVTAAESRTPRREAAASWPAEVTVVLVVGWIFVVLSLDAGSGVWVQRALGVATWGLLTVIACRESPLVRVQTAIVVVFASAVEYAASPLLEVYVYRFHNVPMYIPPGHGLVYLAALAFGRTQLVSAHTRLCSVLALTVIGGYAAYGGFFAARTDVLGALWFTCLVGFLLWGPSPGLYVGATVVVTYLELVGTRLGDWTWQPTDPTGLVSIGNPPSGAAGGYCWFDLAAILLAPTLLRRLRCLARPLVELSALHRLGRRRVPGLGVGWERTDEGEHLVVQPAVGGQRAGAERPWLAVEATEAPAGLVDDHTQGSHVV